MTISFFAKQSAPGLRLPMAVIAAAVALVPPAAIAQADLNLPDEAALIARYALPRSQFVDLDGDRIHFTDEGRGPAIVLVHGSFASLRQWEGWAKALSGRYRVIRFDLPPAGLSGPDQRGDYSVDREIQVIGALTQRLGVQRFFLVATSSGGLAGAGFAAEHPDRILGLVLNNIAVGPLHSDPASISPALKAARAADADLKGYHRQEFWRQVLIQNFADPSKVSPELTKEWTDLNNRAPRMPPSPAFPSVAASFERTPGDLARITAPTLVLWSANDPETTLHPTADKAMQLLATKDKTLAVIPGCGHMMPLECGDAGLALARPFFDRIAKTAR